MSVGSYWQFFCCFFFNRLMGSYAFFFLRVGTQVKLAHWAKGKGYQLICEQVFGSAFFFFLPLDMKKEAFAPVSAGSNSEA